MSRVNAEKKSILQTLTQGDIILLNDGTKCEFVRVKRTRFIGIIDGEGYDIHVNAFDKVIERVDYTVDEDIERLEKGDLFYYSKKGKAMLLRFEEIDDKGNIVGINPVNKGKVSIFKEMFGGLVSDLQE